MKKNDSGHVAAETNLSQLAAFLEFNLNFKTNSDKMTWFGFGKGGEEMYE